MKRTPLKRKTTLKAKPMKRSKITLADVKSAWKKLIAPVSRVRKAAKHLDQYGPAGFGDFVRASGCVVARQSGSLSGCLGPVQHCHRKSRGSGGGWENNSFGACVAHHAEEHAKGQKTFEKIHDLDIDLECIVTTHLWDKEQDGW